MTARITIMVPTLNRPAFVERLVRYYADQNFTGRLLIGDSSTPENAARCRAAVAGVADRLDVEYVDLYQQGCNASMAALAARIDTPYATYIGDDDFIIPAAISAAIAFLDGHPDYVSATGQARNFVLRDGLALGQAIMKGPYPQRSIENETAMERLAWLLFEYTPTIFAVHRTDAWRLMWEKTLATPDRTFGSELLPCCLSAVLGKSKQLDDLYLMRQSHEVTYHLPGRLDWLGDAAWAPSFHTFVETLADHIVRIDGVSRDEAMAGVKRWFHYYLHCDRSSLHHKFRYLHYRMYYPLLPAWKRFRQRHPLAAAVVRSANFAARRTYRFLLSPTGGIGRRVTDAVVRLRDVVMPGNRQAIKGAVDLLARTSSLPKT